MRDDQPIDARDLRKGGWYWNQQELLHVFAPLIGFKAGWLYHAMCFLVPEAIENPKFKITMRVISDTAQMPIGTVHREMAVLIAIGMIDEVKQGNNKPAVYSLVSLRDLAGLGTAELKRRLSVPPGNSGTGGESLEPTSERAPDGPQSSAGRADEQKPDAPEPSPGASASGASYGGTVPLGNTPGDVVTGAYGDGHLFQKQGGTVPEMGGECSKTGGGVFQADDPLIKLSIHQEQIPPVVPVPGTVPVDLPALSFAECRFGDPKFAVNVRDAARWVMEQDGIMAGARQTRALEQAITVAIEREAKDSRSDLASLARTAAANWMRYRSNKGKYVLKIENFFVQGLAFKPEKWGTLFNAAASGSEATVGMQAPADGSSPSRDHCVCYLEHNAAIIERLSICPAVTTRLRELAAAIRVLDDKTEFLDSTEFVLEEIEIQLAEALKNLETADDLQAYRDGIAKDLAPNRGRLTQKQFDEILQQHMQKKLFQAAGVPRLGWFYMPRAT